MPDRKPGRTAGGADPQIEQTARDIQARVQAARAAEALAQGQSAGSIGAALRGAGVGQPGYKKGGTVKETGTYKLHKGEEVLNAKAAKRYRRSNGRG